MSFDPTVLFLSLIISTVGFAIFSYGRKQARWPQMVVGAAMLVYPYFTSGVSSLLAVGAVLVVALWWALRLGW